MEREERQRLIDELKSIQDSNSSSPSADLTESQTYQLLQLHSTASNRHVECFSSRILVKCNQNYLVCDLQKWHCLSQYCFYHKEYYGSHDPSAEVMLKLYVMIERKMKSYDGEHDICSNHCFCSVYQLLWKIEKYHPIDSKLLEGLTKIEGKRCCMFYQLEVYDAICSHDHLTTDAQNIIWSKIMTEFQSAEFIPTTPGFTSSDEKSPYDIIILRKFVLILLKIMKFKRDQDENWFRECMTRIETVVTSCLNIGSESEEWIIQLFLDEDCKLLSACHSMIIISSELMHDVERCHSLMQSLFVSISSRGSSELLLDWLTTDDETSINSLQLLLSYMKLHEGIHDGMKDETKNVLIELNEKIVTLSSRDLFPFRAEPLLKHLRKLNVHHD